MGNGICGCRGSMSEAVEERLTRPQRLPQKPSDVDYAKLRRLILAGKLAPCFDAEDEPRSDLEDCPICLLYFPSLNRSMCCTKGICTECFLQMSASSNITRTVFCPFCKNSNLAVEYFGARTKEEKILEQMEEQKVIEALIRKQYREPCKISHTLPANHDTTLEVHLPNESISNENLHANDVNEMVVMDELLQQPHKDDKFLVNLLVPQTGEIRFCRST